MCCARLAPHPVFPVGTGPLAVRLHAVFGTADFLLTHLSLLSAPPPTSDPLTLPVPRTNAAQRQKALPPGTRHCCSLSVPDLKPKSREFPYSPGTSLFSSGRGTTDLDLNTRSSKPPGTLAPLASSSPNSGALIEP